MSLHDFSESPGKKVFFDRNGSHAGSFSSHSFLENSSTLFEVRSSPHSIRARGVERRSGQQGWDDLLRQQIEGLYVVTRDAAQEILEADVDQRLQPLDSLTRGCRKHGLLQEGEGLLGEAIQLRLDPRLSLGQDQRAELRRAEDRPVRTANLLTAALQDLELVAGVSGRVGAPGPPRRSHA